MKSQHAIAGAALILLCGTGLAQTGDQAAPQDQGTTQQPAPAATPAPQAPPAPTMPTTLPAPIEKRPGETLLAQAQPADVSAQGDSADMSGDTPGASKSSKPTTQTKANKAAEKSSHPAAELTAMQDEKAYRNALRQCAREQDDSVRGSCLDNAIDDFGRNS
jgi:hypothetical protein